MRGPHADVLLAICAGPPAYALNSLAAIGGTMHYRIGLAVVDDGGAGAWVLDLPGCVADGQSPEAALAAAPDAIAAHLAWRARHGLPVPPGAEPISVEAVETFHLYQTEDGEWVSSFFEDERRPLTAGELGDALAQLAVSRRELLAVARPLTPEQLETPLPGQDAQMPSIAAILRHVAHSEWWYLDRLDLAFPEDRLAEDVFARLEQVRSHFRARLPELAGDLRVTVKDGETWSPRKLLRRGLWHELDHVGHVARLAAEHFAAG